MAASELIQHEEEIHTDVEDSVKTADPPSPPQVANGNPARHSSSSSLPPPASPVAADGHDGGKKREHSRSEASSSSSAVKQNRLIRCLSKRLRRHRNYVIIAMPEELANRLPKEWWKTGVAFLYALFNLVFTTVIITIVHERVPDKSVSPPLPDKFFDYVDRVPWAFTVTEVNGLILVGLWSIQWLFLKHK